MNNFFHMSPQCCRSKLLGTINFYCNEIAILTETRFGTLCSKMVSAFISFTEKGMSFF